MSLRGGMMKRNHVAKLVIHGLPDMKQRDAARLIQWLLKTAKELHDEKDRKIFSKRFTARLMQ